MQGAIGDNVARQPGVNPRVAVGALLFGAAAIGFAPVLTRMAMDRGLGPSATAMWRVLLASPIFWAQVLLGARAPQRRAERRAPKRRDWILLAIPGVLFSGDLAFWHWSIKYTTIANATLEANFAAIFVAMAGWLWLGEKLKLTFLVGLALALAGAGALVKVSFDLSAQRLLGDGFGFITAVFYAAYQLSIKHLRRRFGVARILSASSVVAAALLVLISLLSGERLIVAGLGAWAILIALAVVSHAGGQGLIAFAFGHLPVSFSSVSLLFQVVVAAGVAWVFLAERLTAAQIVGGVMVLGGIALARCGSASGHKKTA